MDTDLLLYATGAALPVSAERPVARRAKAHYDAVRLAGLEVAGVIAVGGKIMAGMAQLGAHREARSQGADDFTRYDLLAVQANTREKALHVLDSLTATLGRRV
jgi:hypothetical protein